MSYLIMHNEKDPDTDAPLFWSNVDGWVWLSEATVFTDDERNRLNLANESWGWLLMPEVTP